MKTQRLFHRNFTIMIVGQIISLFGNSILRFALSLYVLDLTGSAAVFGGILALSMIPTVLFSPIGGVLADRLPRQRIMVFLDFLTAGLILAFNILFARSGNLAAITLLMILLSLIQAFYQPSVQASIPSLAAPEQLMAANGTVVQVQALASLAGPIIGGFLYGILGLYPILAASAVCFFCSAVMELFLRIPFTPQEKKGSPLRQVASDLSDALRFLTHEKRELLWLLIIIAGINLFLSALFIVGLPYLIKIHLGLSAQLYGFAEAALGLGTIIGGILSGTAAKRVGFDRCHIFLLGTTAMLLPILLALALHAPALAAYAVMLLSVVVGMMFCALFNIAAQTFLQKLTPNHMLGKIGALVSAICTCALPVGQAMYGALFEAAGSNPWLVVLFGGAVSLMLSLLTRKALAKSVNAKPARLEKEW